MCDRNCILRCIFIVATVVVSVFYILGEKITVINGLGWAGAEYAVMIMTFPDSIHQFTEYHIHRALLPVVLGSVFHIFGIDTVPGNIRIAFIVVNIVSLFASVFMLYKICRALGLTLKLSVFCFFSFIGNYAFIKFPSFYPVLTDWIATPIALLLVVCWMQHRIMCLMFIGLLGVFAHPLLVFLCIIFLAFPCKKSVCLGKNAASVLSGLIYLAAITIVFGSCYYAYVLIVKQDLSVSSVLLAVGLVTTSLCMFFFMHIFCSGLSTAARLLTHCASVSFSGSIKNIIIALATFAATILLSKSLATGSSHLSILNYFANSFQYGSQRPLAFAISHFLYFGPAYALVLFMFRDIVRTSFTLGDAPFVFLILFSVFSVDSESRHIMIFWPFVCILLTKTIAETKISFSRNFLLILLVLSFVLSQAWFPLGIFGDLSGPSEQFPAQWYFMYHGPWMNLAVYVVLVLIFSGFYMAYARSRKQNAGFGEAASLSVHNSAET